ncbi:arp2/3 complex-activating protein rickA-like [Chelonus insularis]|uniref:arp2/3 complex-activating protein rickA-like n=1 Tax=Chelonus insularis TaxID=460826 RepID=UPI00158EF121|nr:arp2/3 complex-activating protein rickA-like [Chelonus insularis]
MLYYFFSFLTMNFLQSKKNVPQLLLLEFYEKNYNPNVYPTTILQLECLKLNLNNLQKIDQKISTVHKNKQMNSEIKNNCDHSKVMNELSNLTLIFQPKSWIPTIEDKMPINSLNPSKDTSTTMQLPFDSILYAPFKEAIDKNISKNSYLFNRQWYYTNLQRQISVVRKWMIENAFVIWIKKNYKIFHQLFGLMYAEALKKKEKLYSVLLIGRNNNEYSLNMIENKITNVMQELHQIREANEETLSVLKQEITILQDHNKTLTKEMENISNVLENISMNIKSIVSQPMKSIPVTEFLIPPPPPPPPPPMPSLPTCFSLSTIPKLTKKNKNSRTPTKKSSEELRPVITVEDLLKVRLKKAPPKNEKENEKKSEAKRFGPVVTIDMLKKVKLKSIKCKSNENVRLPLRTLKNNENNNQS